MAIECFLDVRSVLVVCLVQYGLHSEVLGLARLHHGYRVYILSPLGVLLHHLLVRLNQKFTILLRLLLYFLLVGHT